MAAERLGLLPDSWLQTGQVCATTANALGGGKRRYNAVDFIPARRLYRREQTADEQISRFKQITGIKK